MIESHIDVKTTDDYLLHLFCVGFTKKHNNQVQKTSNAQSASTGPPNPEDDGNHDPRSQTNDLKEVVNKLIPDSIGKDIEKATLCISQG
ncbi:40S ribosomal protein S3a [Manis javanica]|nr:40S ribosomal protein S3a [Manis javanica]